MQIKSQQSPEIAFVKKHVTSLVCLWKVKWIIILPLFVAILCGAYLLGVFSTQIGFSSSFLKPFFYENIRLPLNYIRGQLADYDTLTLDIKHKNFLMLAAKAKEAFEKGRLVTEDDSWVPASITFREKRYKISIRLKGDTLSHLQEEKWSYRVKIKKNKTILGMRKFSLQTPRARNYLCEWLWHKTMKREGVMGLRYEFVKVVLNGKNLGIYALEEHFDKLTIESNKRRESVIVKFNESLLWDEYFSPRVSGFAGKNGNLHVEEQLESSKLTHFGKANPEMQLLREKALALLDAHRSGSLSTSEVFDVEKLALFYAISDLMDGSHALAWANQRFYYNPVTGKLEPVAFDNARGFYIQTIAYLEERENYMGQKRKERLFSDRKFLASYFRALDKVTSIEYVNMLFEQLHDQIESKRDIIFNSYPWYHFSQKYIRANASFIRKLIHPVKPIYAHYAAFSGQKISVEIANIQAIPIELLSLKADGVIYKPTSDYFIKPKKAGEAPVYSRIDFATESGRPPAYNPSLVDSKIELTYSVFGLDQKYHEIIEPSRRQEPDFTSDIMRQSANFTDFDFIRVDERSREIHIEGKDVTISKDLVVSEGFNIIVRAGTSISLENGSKIVSRSPAYFMGTANNPIHVTSKDKSGQGLLFIGTSGKSEFSNVVFKNLSPVDDDSLRITASITFYESPVTIRRCVFKNNVKGDDYLNIFRTNFEIYDSTFENVFADAIDSDFATGKVISSSFVGIGNDGVDFSGSKVELADLSFNKIGDKAISAGELSIVAGSGISIRNSEIAVSAKDNSIVELANSAISDSKIAFAVFQKKSEFGPGKIIGSEIKMEKIGRAYLVEEGSHLIVQGKVIEYSKDVGEVKEILYGKEFGKASGQ